MFNVKLRKWAQKVYEEAAKEYDESVELHNKKCEELYEERKKSIDLIEITERVINSISHSSMKFDTNLGDISGNVEKFREKEKIAREAFGNDIKAFIRTTGGVTTGIGIATLTEPLLMSVATTYGVASTGTAISALTGAAAQKAAVAWIGRTFAGIFATNAGMAAGQAFLSLAGPVGWTVSAVATTTSLAAFSKDNRETADQAVEEAKKLITLKEENNKSTAKVSSLLERTRLAMQRLYLYRETIFGLRDSDYSNLTEEEKIFLAHVVNNMCVLAALLNEDVVLE